MGLGRNVAMIAGIGLLSLAVSIGHTPQARAEDPQSAAAFAAWKSAHPNVVAQIADLKAKTAAMVKSVPPLPAAQQPTKFADLAARSAALSPQQKEQAQKLFDEGFRHWQLRDFVGAKKYLGDGLAIDPANGTGNFYLGDILVHEGDNVAAALSMERAIALAPNTPDGKKAAEALPTIPLPVVDDPSLDRPPSIWRVPGAIEELWDSADAPRMVVIPAGEYTMGSPSTEAGRDNNEGPRHRVRIGYPLAVGKYPITVGQFAKFVAESGYDAGDRCETFKNGKFDFLIGYGWRNPGFAQTDDSPVVCLNSHDVKAYIDWISKKTGHSYRLLSEGEYEYVTRAGTTTAYWWGDDPLAACTFVNGGDLDAKAEPQLSYWTVNNCHDGYVFTAPVNSFKPNPFGLYGISGNANSWLQDCWSETYNGASNDGSAKVDEHCYEPMIRGGSWADKPTSLRSALRGWNIHNIRFSMNGFRIARGL